MSSFHRCGGWWLWFCCPSLRGWCALCWVSAVAVGSAGVVLLVAVRGRSVAALFGFVGGFLSGCCWCIGWTFSGCCGRFCELWRDPQRGRPPPLSGAREWLKIPEKLKREIQKCIDIQKCICYNKNILKEVIT